MGLKKTQGFQLLTSLGSIHVENNPYIYIFTVYQGSISKQAHKNLNLECYFFGVFFLLASRSCAISQFRPMKDDIHCVDPLTTSNFWMPEMVWRLHMWFFVFSLCSNMFQHVPYDAWHSHALTVGWNPSCGRRHHEVRETSSHLRKAGHLDTTWPNGCLPRDPAIWCFICFPWKIRKITWIIWWFS
jgi:hypothetical protein